MYKHSCGHTHPSPFGEGLGVRLHSLADGPFDDLLNKIAEKLFNEKVSRGYIDDGLYQKTAEDLLKAMHGGLGGATFSFEDPRNTLKAYFEQNIYSFSAAKSQAELLQFRSLLTDSNGNARTFIEFRNSVIDAGYQFNNTWLKTEYNTANASAQSAAQWQKFIENGTEILEYTTAGDGRVRPAHAVLDGFTAKIDDPVWNIIYPPEDWNCRCWVIPGLAQNIGLINPDMEMVKENIPVQFQKNVGTTKTIFSDDIPYYKAGGANPKELMAEKNYGMPSVQKLYSKYDFPAKIELADKAAANAWWSDMAGGLRSDFYIKDVNNVVIKLDNNFRFHISEQNADKRWKFIANIPEIIKSPDEIWSLKEKGQLKRYYLKYYNDAPIVVMVNATDTEPLRAYTATELQRGGKMNVANINKIRRGTLIYRNNR